MVRKKEKPSHLNNTRHKQVTWNLPDSSENISDDDNIPDLIDDSEDDDSYEPPPSYCRNYPEDKLHNDDYDDIEVVDNYQPNCSSSFKSKDKSYLSDKETCKRIKKSKKDNEIDYGLFNIVLQKCEFSVQVDTKLSESLVHCLFGRISLSIINFDVDFQIKDTFWVYVSRECDQSAIYFEWHDSNIESPIKNSFKKPKANSFKYFHVLGNLDTNIWAGLVTRRTFQLVIDEVDSDILHINIYLLKSALVKLNSPSEFHHGNRYLSSLCSLFYFVKSFEKMGVKNHKRDVDVLYKFVKNFHSDKNYNVINPQHPNLIPLLRPYQKQAVRWMLFQEETKVHEDPKKLHPLYVEINSLDNVVLYYNRFGKYFVSEKPYEVLPCPGGILADEMGLGKTVEVLSCVMCHPRPNYSSPFEYNLEAHKEKNSVNMEGKFEIRKVESSPLIEDGSLFCGENGDSYSCRKRSKRKTSRIVNYSLLDSVLDSDKDSNYDPNISEEEREKDPNFEEEREDIKHEYIFEEKVTRRSKRKTLNNYYSELDDDDDIFTEPEYESNKKRRIDSPNIVNIEEEITSNPIVSIIEKVILDRCWDGVIKNYKKEGSYKEYRKFLKKRKKDPYYMMTLQERLKLDYENKLAAYSVDALKYNAYKGFFETKVEQKSYFECVCGRHDNTENSADKMQCTKCSLWQHAICVQFKLTDTNRSEYICPHCWTLQPPVLSGATLIVAPSSISHQWVEEIKKHVRDKSLRVLVYQGVAKHGYIQPHCLASYDIVITTYGTLRREVNYVDLPHSNSEEGRKFRFPKRFMTIPSPLPCVEWWRVCLDEAQMVEGTCTKTAEMALRLMAVNRWCITGTPVQKSVNDLQGLLMFLGVDPYFVHHWWNQCLYEPYCYEETEPLHSVVAKFMWRNSKLDVVNELDIPPQTEEVHWLCFTPVEDHFYRRLHSECSDEALKRIKKFPNRTVKLSSLDRKSFSSLVQPLLKLRQACDHPQVVRGHFTGLNRQTLTMEQLLDNLLKKTQLEAEDAQRIIVASLNGLAALDIIQGNFVEAVAKYREVLQSIEEHKENVKTDSLQQLHTLHNLSEIIDSKGIPPTLRDATLKEEAKVIRDKHLKIYPQRISEAELECRQNTLTVEEQKEKYNNKIDWWLVALETLDEEFVQEVREGLLSQYSRFEEKKCMFFSVQNKAQMMQLLRAKFKVLYNQRKYMLSSVRDLLDIDPDSILNEAIDCHLRPFDTNRNLCVLCCKHEVFEDYEENLFFMKEKKTVRSTERAQETMDMKGKIQLLETTRQGNWGQGEIERVLRYLQTKSLGRVDSSVHEDSQTHLSILQAMKKEFKNYRILWRAIYDRVSALDEVNMATLRFRLRLPGEELLTTKKKKNNELSKDLEEKFDAPKHILERGEIAQQEMKLRSDKIVSQSDLRVKLGQYFYLKNLKNIDFGADGGSNPEPCPVCQGTLGVKWKVLLCGHSFCMDCVSFLIKKVININGSLKCPICRQPTRIKEIAYVDMRSSEDQKEVKVSGSLSTKIEGVVRVMLKIKSSDPEAKVLIFSTWNEVLEVIADGFRQNGITHRMLLSRNKFQETLAAFKSKQEITVLLIPLSSGANGLNIVEASHVILVEPILNPAAEFQAIGRVHRIGQDKPTVVHRFIIHDTIEERMHKILHSKYEEKSSDENSVTIEDLYQLFARESDDRVVRAEDRNGEQSIEEIG